MEEYYDDFEIWQQQKKKKKKNPTCSYQLDVNFIFQVLSRDPAVGFTGWRYHWPGKGTIGESHDLFH